MITYRFGATDRKICAETMLLKFLKLSFYWRGLDNISLAHQVTLALLSGETWILILVVTSSGQKIVGQASPREKKKKEKKNLKKPNLFMKSHLFNAISCARIKSFQYRGKHSKISIMQTVAPLEFIQCLSFFLIQRMVPFH